MNSVLKQIDNISMIFEDSWNYQNGIEQIFKFVDEQDLCQIGPATMIAELILIDIDRRWQHWSRRSFEANAAKQAIAELLDQHSLSDYLNQAKQQGIEFTQCQLREMETGELISRTKHGDAPLPFAGIEIAQFEQLIKYRPQISISHKDIKFFEDGFSGKIEIGRQAINEPQPVSWLNRDRFTKKLVCAKGDEAFVSRNQMIVQVINSRQAIVENPSRNRHFCIVDGETIGPKRCSVVDLPFEVDFEVFKITFKRAILSAR